VAANTASGPGFVGGGGIALRGTSFDISHATLADNVLTGSAEAGQSMIFFVNGTTGTMRNSITSGHTGLNSFYSDANTSNVTLDRVLSNDTTTTLLTVAAGGQTTEQNGSTGNPNFAAPGSPSYDYRIGFGSAAINKATGSTVTNDVENQPRPIGTVADLGADEYEVGLAAISDDTTISLTVTPPPGTNVTEYRVFYTKENGANDANEGASGFSAGTSTNITLTGLSPHKSYTIKVVAYVGATPATESILITLSTGRFFINLPLIAY
jgi:hypothetical protein